MSTGLYQLSYPAMRMPAAYAYRGHSEFVSEQCQVPAMHSLSWCAADSRMLPLAAQVVILMRSGSSSETPTGRPRNYLSVIAWPKDVGVTGGSGEI